MIKKNPNIDFNKYIDQTLNVQNASQKGFVWKKDVLCEIDEVTSPKWRSKVDLFYDDILGKPRKMDVSDSLREMLYGVYEKVIPYPDFLPSILYYDPDINITNSINNGYIWVKDFEIINKVDEKTHQIANQLYLHRFISGQPKKNPSESIGLYKDIGIYFRD